PWGRHLRGQRHRAGSVPYDRHLALVADPKAGIFALADLWIRPGPVRLYAARREPQLGHASTAECAGSAKSRIALFAGDGRLTFSPRYDTQEAAAAAVPRTRASAANGQCLRSPIHIVGDLPGANNRSSGYCGRYRVP